MNYKINDSLPIKYTLDLHRSLPAYPTHQDFMFEVISYLIKVSEKKGKPLDPNDLKFSSKTLKYIFGDEFKSEEFLVRIKTILSELREANVLDKVDEQVFIKADEVSRYYIII